MNTKTMRLPPRRVLTQTSGPPTLNKRKEREDGFDTPKPSTPKLLKPDNNKPRPGGGSAPSNQLLAGYLAHEFLTRGTLFGQPWGPPTPEGPTDKRKGKQKGEAEPQPQPPARKRTEMAPEKYERYVEVVGLLNVEGAHLPGIVNPTQLARFLQL
ncbi:uncharacterized protein G2W53_043726 [Senna tora]|uniref:Uncharacterized protein n=1 Tax=Senna tora TaxID=362788 RepID=A0A834SLQ6_9FABA|nr:uncharacterized protein G2W53_043726 [Senna tora]